MKVTTSLDDNEVKSYVEQLEKIVLTGKPFFTYSMKVKKFLFDLMRNYLEERTNKPEGEHIE